MITAEQIYNAHAVVVRSKNPHLAPENFRLWEALDPGEQGPYESVATWLATAPASELEYGALLLNDGLLRVYGSNVGLTPTLWDSRRAELTADWLLTLDALTPAQVEEPRP